MSIHRFPIQQGCLRFDLVSVAVIWGQETQPLLQGVGRLRAFHRDTLRPHVPHPEDVKGNPGFDWEWNLVGLSPSPDLYTSFDSYDTVQC